MRYHTSQLIGLIVIFIYAVFGLQFFADRAEVSISEKRQVGHTEEVVVLQMLTAICLN